MRGAGRALDRAGPNDLMQLASDVGPLPMQVAGVLVLDTRAGFGIDAACDLLARRAASVPRLTERLVAAPFGCGRPYWVTDPSSDPRRHVQVRACAGPGDEAALMEAALALAGSRLPPSRPLWSATFVTGLSGGRVALVVVLHHVVADGMGALAVLGALVDGSPSAPRNDPGDVPRTPPSWWTLAADAWTTRLSAVVHVVPRLRRMGRALAELGTGRPAMAPRCSLNRPTGSRRRAVVVRTDLTGVVGAAHAHGATVNDVVLAAVGGALGAVLAARGEHPATVVVSVPVSGRADAEARTLGNQVGVMPVPVPTVGDALSRLEAVARVTRARRSTTPGDSAALLQPAFRALSALGLLHWLVDRQRLVTTFVTNLRGLSAPMTVAGAPVTDALVVAGISGNVTVSFAVLSYTGTLTITVLVDPDHVSEHEALAAALGAGLDALAATAAPLP